MDLTIKNVPTGAEEQVKQMALIAIDKYLQLALQPPKEILENYKTTIDAVLIANGLDPKFKEVENIE